MAGFMLVSVLRSILTASLPEHAMAPTQPAAQPARAAEIAAAHADQVDADSRFPQEALDALRQEKLLGVMVPKPLGGEHASFADVVDVCYTLGRACSSTGMIYAKHQVKAACITHRGMDSQWHRDFMTRM